MRTVLLALLLVSCVAPRAGAERSGVVASGAPLASEVGARVLAEGGNAVDAAVATAFALAVVEPTMSGIGGRSQVLVRIADGAVFGMDGTTAVPAGYPPGRETSESAYGYGTIGIPGTVAVLAAVLERAGTWPLARVLAPAIALAEHGFALPAPEAARMASEAARLREFAGSRAHFLRADGSMYAAGDTYRQPALARTLRAIAAGGADAFYRGPIATAMVADMRAHGGWLRAADLADYRPTEAIVVRGSYRDRQLIGTYLPASGATTIQALQVLDHFDLRSVAGTAEWIDIIARALLLSFEDRETATGSAADAAARITSRARAAELADQLRAGRRSPARERYEPAHTTHLSVLDHNGMAVALTQSVGPNMGSRVATAELGFLYAATMGYLGDLQPGDRPWSSQSPLIVLRDGRVEHVLGGAGARRIISALVETLVRAIDQDLSLPQALAAPRFHVAGNTIYLERRAGAAWSEAVEDELRARGYAVEPRADASYFARLNVVGIDGAGATRGAADPRWPGAVSFERQ